MCVLGEYMYVEASNRKLNDKTRIISPPLTMKGDTCVLFWYHMYGKTVGKLNLYAKVCYICWCWSCYNSRTQYDHWIPQVQWAAEKYPTIFSVIIQLYYTLLCLKKA